MIIEHIGEIEISKSKIYTKPYLLSTENLTKLYGNVKAVSNISVNSFTSFLGLLGPNGSGKSTLIKLLLGLIKPDEGNVELGVNRDYIRMIPDYPILPEHLTIDEWMNVLESYYGHPPRNLDIEGEFRLNGRWKIGQLSMGQKRLTSLMPIFFGDPGLLILDEPSNFIDILMREKVLNLIKDQIKRKEAKVIISSHRIDEMELLASEILLLHKGELVAKFSLKLDERLGYTIRVNNFDAFQQYLDNYEVEYELKSTLMGKAFAVNQITDLIDPIADYNRDGGYVFNINQVNTLIKRLGELR